LNILLLPEVDLEELLKVLAVVLGVGVVLADTKLHQVLLFLLAWQLLLP
jgi:hypothetical protein